MDRQISFPLSSVLHANGQRNGQPLLHDFTEDIQFMDIEETSGKQCHPFSLPLALRYFRLIYLFIRKKLFDQVNVSIIECITTTKMTLTFFIFVEDNKLSVSRTRA